MLPKTSFCILGKVILTIPKETIGINLLLFVETLEKRLKLINDFWIVLQILA